MARGGYRQTTAMPWGRQGVRRPVGVSTFCMFECLECLGVVIDSGRRQSLRTPAAGRRQQVAAVASAAILTSPRFRSAAAEMW